MAIKPTDCILQLDKIRSIEYSADSAWSSMSVVKKYVYPAFWTNFQKHVDRIGRAQGNFEAEAVALQQHRKKYNAEYKAKGNKEWVKFETAQDLLYFKKRWL